MFVLERVGSNAYRLLRCVALVIPFLSMVCRLPMEAKEIQVIKRPRYVATNREVVWLSQEDDLQGFAHAKDSFGRAPALVFFHGVIAHRDRAQEADPDCQGPI